MTEPRRWREAGASDEIRRMLSAGRGTRALPAEVRGRVARRLGASAGVAAATSILLTWKGFAVAAAIGVASVIVALELDRPLAAPPVQPAPRPPATAGTVEARVAPPLPTTPTVESAPPQSVSTPPRIASASPRVAPSTLTPLASSAPGPHASSSPLQVPPAPAASAPKPEGTLAREITLLERARSRLDTDPAGTLAVLDEHARAFPGGQLSIEREVMALDALQRLGRAVEANARARTLLERARGTIYEARIRRHLRP